MGKGVRVLCVDDEPMVLDGLENHLAMRYDCHLAESGAAGLDKLDREGPFAVVISDMRMPEMDGATFLAKARRLHPQTVRMLLTGYADLDAATQAVNQGQVFRFLQKPCAPKVLLEAVDAAVRQHQLLRAEEDLLENTFNGAIKVLIDVLQVTAPEIFSRSVHVKGFARHIGHRLHLGDHWHIETAALLSQIGCITVPPDVLARLQEGAKLSSAEKEMLRRHPQVGRDLLISIPRLDLVAKMVGAQAKAVSKDVTLEPTTEEQRISLGAAVIRLASRADAFVRRGAPMSKVVARLHQEDRYSPSLVAALEGYQPPAATVGSRKSLPLSDLRPGMMLVDDVCSRGGTVVLAGGRLLDSALLHRLRNFAARGGVVEPITVGMTDDKASSLAVSVSIAPARPASLSRNA